MEWAPPTQDIETTVQTDGTSRAPSIEVRSSTESTEAETGAPAAAGGLAPRVDLAPGFSKSRWKVTVFVAQATTMDDNINISNSNKESDVSFSLTPDISAGWGDVPGIEVLQSSLFFDRYGPARAPVSDPLSGDFAYLNYAPTAIHYLSHDSDDSVDESASLAAHWAFTKVQVGLNASFESSSGANIDVGMRTKRDVFGIDLTTNYALSDKTSFAFDTGGSVNNYITQLSSSDWHANLSANYQLSHKTSFGLSLGAGLRLMQSSANEYYQQLTLTASYQPTDRLSLSANGGAEIDEDNGSPQLNPIFGVTAAYKLNDRDSISLDASGQITSSAAATNETVDTTSVDCQVNHRILSSLSFGCGVGYHHAEYMGHGPSTLSRTDDYLYVGPSLAYSFTQGSQISLSYEYHRNLSTVQSFGFVESLATLSVKLVF
jgi:hypothetical protein